MAGIINDDARFIVENGIPRIENAFVIPQDDNFDYVSGDWTTIIGNVWIRFRTLVPSGYKVELNFTTEAGDPPPPYQREDFDAQRTRTQVLEQEYEELKYRYNSESVIGDTLGGVKDGQLAFLFDAIERELEKISPFPSLSDIIPDPSDIDPSDYAVAPCFAAGTPVLLGDTILAFSADGALMPAVVARLIPGITEEWIALRTNGEEEITYVTPGHQFLDARGHFRSIAEIMADEGPTGRRIVLRDGSIIAVAAQSIRYGEEIAHRYQQPEKTILASGGATALAPQIA